MIKLILYLIVNLIFIVSCSVPEGETVLSSKTEINSVTLNSLSLTAYTSQTVTLKVKGQLPSKNTTLLNTIRFFNNKTCTGTYLASGVAQDFVNNGIELSLPLEVKTTSPKTYKINEIYLSTNTLSECFHVTDYEFTASSVVNASFSRTSPISPTQSVLNPLIFGTAIENSNIKFYNDLNCSQLIGQGTNLQLSSSGIRLLVLAESRNQIYAQVEDSLGNFSSCGYMTDYVHTTQVGVSPTLTSIAPASPSKLSTTPVITGTTGLAAVSVELYNNSICTQIVGQGTANEYSTTGIQISISQNTTNYIYVKSIDEDGTASSCTYLTQYTHDNIAPQSPLYLTSSPTAPTRLTIYPYIYGQTQSSDTAVVKLYNSFLCLQEIGSGSKNDLEFYGVMATLFENSTTPIYAKAFDTAGNASDCTFFLNFKHNTIPPETPVISDTIPISPNNISDRPFLKGSSSDTTTQLYFFSDSVCNAQIGQGTPRNFMNSGIQVITPSVPNSVNITNIYGQAEDEEGNRSDCTSLTIYGYSTAQSPDATFTSTSPASPSKYISNPYIIGTTLSTVTTVQIYNDSDCLNLLKSGTRSAYQTVGLQVSLTANQSSDLYAKTIDIYGNSSNCVFLTSYIHDSLPPDAPAYTDVTPDSPTKITGSPSITGSVNLYAIGKPLPVSIVRFYNDDMCLGYLAEGVPVDLSSIGIVVPVFSNVDVPIYAQSVDAVGNMSTCQYFTNYIYSTINPGAPTLISVSPNSPSFTEFVHLNGDLLSTISIVSPNTVSLYKDSSCGQILASGSYSSWQSSGFDIVTDRNSVTSIYGQTTDIVNNQSACTFLMNYVHSDAGPSGLTAHLVNGSALLNWNADATASPAATYTIKRSKTSGGPYTVLKENNLTISYTDAEVEDGMTYYYVVSAENNTGSSYNSNEVSITITVPTPVVPLSLTAISLNGGVSLNWVSHSSNLFYKILRSNQPNGPYTLVESNITNSYYYDLSLTNDSPYYYVVVGTNVKGNSVYSNEVSVIPRGNPAATSNLSLSLVKASSSCSGQDGVLLTWTPVNYATGYRVLRSDNNSTYTSPTADLAATTTSWVDCLPQGDRDQYYVIQSLWGSAPYESVSVNSNYVVFHNAAAPNVTVYPGQGHINLQWDPVNSAISYQVWRSTQSQWPDSSFIQIQSSVPSNSPKVTYSDSTVTNGVTYYYVVIPNFSGGLIGFSSNVRSGLARLNPTSPSNLIVIEHPTSNKRPVLYWSGSNYVNYYNVYRSSNGSAFSCITCPSNGGSPTSVNTFTDTTATNSGLHQYYVSAQWGNYESSVTNTVSYRYGYISSTPTLAQNLTSLVLSWTTFTGAASYKVYRGLTNDTSSMSLISTVTAPTTTLTNSTTVPAGFGVSTGQAYFYSVQPYFSDTTVGQFSPTVAGSLSGTTVVSGVTVVDSTSTDVTITWANLITASSYFIYISSSSGGPYTYLGVASSNQFTVTSLSSNTLYYVKVANASCNTSCLSNYATLVISPKPFISLIKAGHNTVNVNFTVAPNQSVDILRSTDGVNYSVYATSVAGTSYYDPSATNGNVYYYKVRANYLNGVSKTSDAAAPVIPGVVPVAPDQIWVTGNTTGTSVSVNWNAMEGVNEYKVYLSTTSNDAAATVYTSSTSSYPLSPLIAGTRYYVRVKSVNGLIESSSYSTEFSFVTAVQPAAPSLSVQGSQIYISWPSVAGASQYKLFKSVDGNNFNLLATTSSLNYSDSSVVLEQFYYYKILPIHSTGLNLSESQVAGPINFIQILAPTNVIVHANSNSQINLNWILSASSGISYYNIYRSTSSSSGFTVIGSSITGSYVDNNSLILGSTYYYKITAVNASNVESSFSNLVSLYLSSGPSSLTGSALNQINRLTWSAVASATGYVIYRSVSSGGPYGLLQTVNASTFTFDDTSISNGVTYYYRVAASFASGAISIQSGELSLLAIKKISLSVPIELTDIPLSSSSLQNTVFEKTQTSLNTNDYDGDSVNYRFEVVASNSDSNVKNIHLVDINDNVVGSISVPANTNDLTRFEVNITPTSGEEIYKISIAQTQLDNQVVVSSAKLWVDQVMATKTKLYFPITYSTNSPSYFDLNNSIFSTSNSVLQIANEQTNFIKDLTYQSGVAEFNAWQFETVVSSFGSSMVTSLYNNTTSRVVSSTQVSFADTSIKYYKTTFSENVSQFGSANNGQNYSIGLRCFKDCHLGGGHVYKAGLWLKLVDINQAEILVRNSGYVSNISSAQQNLYFRSKINLSQFTNPQIYFRATARKLISDIYPLVVRLKTNGQTAGADSAIDYLSSVTGSDLSFTSTTFQTQTTASPLAISSGDRILTEFETYNTSAQVKDSFIIIRTSQ